MRKKLMRSEHRHIENVLFYVSQSYKALLFLTFILSQASLEKPVTWIIIRA